MIESLLENTKVRDIVGVRDEIWSVDADDTADVAALNIMKHKIRTLGVLKEGELVGVVGNNDFARKVVAKGRVPGQVKVSDIMTTNLRTVDLDSLFMECLNMMEEHHITHLVVLDDDRKYYGMLTWYDLHRRLVKMLREQLDILHEYAFGPSVQEQADVND